MTVLCGLGAVEVEVEVEVELGGGRSGEVSEEMEAIVDIRLLSLIPFTWRSY